MTYEDDRRVRRIAMLLFIFSLFLVLGAIYSIQIGSP